MSRDSFENGGTEFFSEEHSEEDRATLEYIVRTSGNHGSGSLCCLAA
jgi:hypothetical protein